MLFASLFFLRIVSSRCPDQPSKIFFTPSIYIAKGYSTSEPTPPQPTYTQNPSTLHGFQETPDPTRKGSLFFPNKFFLIYRNIADLILLIYVRAYVLNSPSSSWPPNPKQNLALPRGPNTLPRTQRTLLDRFFRFFMQLQSLVGTAFAVSQFCFQNMQHARRQPPGLPGENSSPPPPNPRPLPQIGP